MAGSIHGSDLVGVDSKVKVSEKSLQFHQVFFLPIYQTQSLSTRRNNIFHVNSLCSPFHLKSQPTRSSFTSLQMADNLRRSGSFSLQTANPLAEILSTTKVNQLDVAKHHLVKLKTEQKIKEVLSVSKVDV